MILLATAAVFASGTAPVETAGAEELWSDGQAALRLDTTVQFTGAFRLAPRQSRLVAGANSDESDRSFTPGFVSQRTDVFSELDADDGDVGVRISGAGWYDPVYLQRNADDSPATFNPASVAHDRFTRALQGLEGEGAELLDGFAHASFAVGDAQAGVRIGRHTLIWGESLFFGQNGIAAAQAPTDFIKAASVPNTRARELFLPVNQVSASLQIRPGLSVEAYDQLEWRPDRLPGVGSYFSTADILDAGGERIMVSPGDYLYRMADRRPGALGQFGAAVRATVADADLGLYVLRYNAREAFVATGGCAGACGQPGQSGTYRLTYARGVEVIGASASTFLGDNNLAGEISWRHHGPLLASPGPDAAGLRGDTAHGQVSIVAERPAGAFWDQINLSAELAGNTLLSSLSGQATPAPGVTRSAAAVQGQLALDYFHVLPGLDVTPFVAVSYGLAGRSPVDREMVEGAGDVTAGIGATYRAVWHLEVRATDYIGSAGRQPLADRSFASLNVRRSF